uniref:helix-turn-helix domain-containing protein n=1 Tax=Streptomyces marianii TaxID=1817406 RepID=UPI002D76C26C|nr:helix-turn-helix domain-containing protein [Streptomyces marianii]
MDFEIRKVRTAQGPVKLRREREAYSRLVQQGYSNTEACRIVGVDRRTGNKWRNGRSADRRQKAAPPISAVAPPSGTSRYLREEERIHIADRLREKATVRAIAAELGRSPSTVSREIRRNRTDGARGLRGTRTSDALHEAVGSEGRSVRGRGGPVARRRDGRKATARRPPGGAGTVAARREAPAGPTRLRDGGGLRPPRCTHRGPRRRRPW